MKKKFLTLLSLSLLLTISSFAQSNNFKSENKIVVKHMEDRVYGKLVEIDITKNTVEYSYIELRDHSGELLYTESIKGLKYTKVFSFDIPDEEIKKGVILTVYDKKRKTPESIVITK